MNIKTLSAIALVTAALSGPVFAQDANVAPAHAHKPLKALRHYRGSYNQVQEPAYVVAPAVDPWGAENRFDRSRIGDQDPNFNPPS
jgi:hypothetical protein